MLSAISTAGIRPEKLALVYPYVTLAMYFKPSCRALRMRVSAYTKSIKRWNGLVEDEQLYRF